MVDSSADRDIDLDVAGADDSHLDGSHMVGAGSGSADRELEDLRWETGLHRLLDTARLMGRCCTGYIVVAVGRESGFAVVVVHHIEMVVVDCSCVVVVVGGSKAGCGLVAGYSYVEVVLRRHNNLDSTSSCLFYPTMI